MSIARIVALAVSATTTQVAVWAALECSIAIVVACSPVLRPLFRRPGETEFSVSSLRSTHPKGEGRPPTKPNRSNPDRAQDVGSTDFTRDSSEFEMMAPTNGHHIFKSVDFEISSERASQAGPATRVRIENWML